MVNLFYIVSIYFIFKILNRIHSGDKINKLLTLIFSCLPILTLGVNEVGMNLFLFLSAIIVSWIGINTKLKTSGYFYLSIVPHLICFALRTNVLINFFLYVLAIKIAVMNIKGFEKTIGEEKAHLFNSSLILLLGTFILTALDISYFHQLRISEFDTSHYVVGFSLLILTFQTLNFFGENKKWNSKFSKEFEYLYLVEYFLLPVSLFIKQADLFKTLLSYGNLWFPLIIVVLVFCVNFWLSIKSKDFLASHTTVAWNSFSIFFTCSYLGESAMTFLMIALALNYVFWIFYKRNEHNRLNAVLYLALPFSPIFLLELHALSQLNIGLEKQQLVPLVLTMFIPIIFFSRFLTRKIDG